MLSNLARGLAVGMVAVFILLAAGTGHAAEKINQDVSVAVLPFEVNAGDDLSYLKDSLPELLADRLKESGFRVIAPEEVGRIVADKGYAQYDPEKAREIALLAKSQFSVYGSLNQIGENLTIDARLVDAYAKGPGKKISVTKKGLINLLPAVDALVDHMRMDLLRLDIVSEIDVEGTKVLDKDVVLMRMTMQKGDMITAKSVNTALKNVYDLGYFDDVSVRIDDVEDGKKVVFVVKEKPRIQAIGVRGAKEIDSADILEAVSTKKGSVVNPKVLADDIRVIREMYRKEGYYKANITQEIDDAGTGIARLTFVIDEGPQLYIEHVIIDGAKQLDPDDIKDILALKERGWLSWIDDSGVLKEELLDRDASAIMAYYQSKGFLTAKVGQPEVEIKDDGIDVIYKVWEGDRFKMGDTTFTGDLLDDPSKLLQVTKIDELKAEDQYFDRLVMQKDISALTSYYNDYGYAYADVGVKLDDDPETKIVNVVYNISKHQRVHIRRVLIEGNTVTRDNVILREMRLADGDQFSGEKLKRSSQRLTNLDFFEKVDIAPVPTGNPEEMDLVVKVKDKATGKISGGVGYSTYDGVFFGGEISEKNLFGRGYDVGFNGQIGGSSTKYVLHFTNPHINDTDLGFGSKLYRRSTDYSQYTIDGTGGTVNFFYPIGEYTKIKWDYNLEAYDIKDVTSRASQDIKDDEGSHLASILSSQIVRDTRDDFNNTTTGTTSKVTLSFGGGPLGGTDDFIKLTGSFEWWNPVLEQVVFHSKFWAGYLHKNFGGDDVPTAERFDLGGVYTIRGYSKYLVTPTEGPNSDASVGGDKAFYTNLELKRPLSKELGIVALAFFDAGNSWKEGEQWFESVKRGGVAEPSLGLYKSVGAGINWYSPVGPVGLIYAYALDDLVDSKVHTVELIMGQQF